MRGYKFSDPENKVDLILSFAGVPEDLDPPTKLSENIILNILVQMDDTLRSSAY